ncbi:MAG: LAGLIDADG family homing endonuclease [archaeon]
MRVLVTEDSKKSLLNSMKERYNCKTLDELSKKIEINKKTLEGWFYIKERYLPYELLLPFINNSTIIIDKKENNWGQVYGGKKGYKRIVEKYGIEKLRQINSLGGKRAAKSKALLFKDFNIDLENPIFLEIYGILLGDGWLNSPTANNKWSIGICGNLSLDKEFILYVKKNVSLLLDRQGYTREREKGNVIEFRFGHRGFFKILNEKLKFPIGIKEKLYLPEIIYSKGYGKVKYVIRGIFDTDGSFFLAKNRKKVPSYPCISIHMKEQRLMKQIAETLSLNGFKVVFEEKNCQIRINGKEQLKKWMREIGSSNRKHLNKIESYLQSH